MKIRLLKIALPILLVFLFFTLARAIQTPEVEIGNGGSYDGTVKIRRDAQGRMLFSDGQVTAPVTLNDLRYSGIDHGLMLGLADDDHPQYQTPLRHGAAHSAVFNGALATPADLHGNATLGAHLLDAVIHPLPGIYEPAFAAGTTAQYRRGDKSWQTLNQAAVAGLKATDSPTFSGLNLGTDGGGVRSLFIYSDAAGKFGMLSTLAGGDFVASSQRGLTLTTGNTFNCTLSAGADILLCDRAFNNRLTVNTITGALNCGIGTGGLNVNGIERISNTGAAALAQATVDNLRLDGNTLSSLDANGNIALAPNGTGQVTVSGDLAVGSGNGRILLNGQRLSPGRNLLDNPDFNIWQRNITQTCAAGGNAGGTITWPVPGTLATGADRWQVSRSKTDMISTISRATPPGTLPAAVYCLKNEYVSGTDCWQYIHQTLPREVTASLRGKWVTFAVSHYLNGEGGGNVAIYKFVGSTATALVNFAFTATPNAWDRLAVAAQVPNDADFIAVCIKSNLSSGGASTAYIANAALVDGKLAGTAEKASDPAASSLPALPRIPAEDLERCQRYYEKGIFCFSGYTADTDANTYYNTVHFNTAKAATPAIALSNVNGSGLSGLSITTDPQPAYSAGQSWPQGFMVSISGSAAGAGPLNFSGEWAATCPEPN